MKRYSQLDERRHSQPVSYCYRQPIGISAAFRRLLLHILLTRGPLPFPADILLLYAMYYMTAFTAGRAGRHAAMHF